MLSTTYTTNLAGGYAEVSRDRHEGFTLPRSSPYFRHLLITQFAVGVGGSSGRAISFSHVSHVLSVCPQDKMGGIHASRSVACVPNEHPIWNLTNESCVEHPVRSDLSPHTIHETRYPTISLLAQCAHPQPAPRLAGYVRPGQGLLHENRDTCPDTPLVVNVLSHLSHHLKRPPALVRGGGRGLRGVRAFPSPVEDAGATLEDGEGRAGG